MAKLLKEANKYLKGLSDLDLINEILDNLIQESEWTELNKRIKDIKNSLYFLKKD